MLYFGYLPFVKYRFNYYLMLTSNSTINKEFFCIFISNKYLFYFFLTLKKSLFFQHTQLMDFKCLDQNFNVKGVNLKSIWYFLNLNYIKKLLVVSFYSHSVKTFESIFFNLKWLERENSDFYGLVFLNKKDNRPLFLIPYFYSNTLLKNYPTNGFYEITNCFFLRKLKFKKNSNLV